MEYIINFFNNREKALIIWIVAVSVFLLINKNFRPSFLAVLKAFLARKIVTALLIMLAYISLIVFAAYELHVWDLSLLKDTIVWVLGTALVMFINYDKAYKEEKYFKDVLLDNVKLVVFLGFLINLYVFNLVVELLLVPVLFVVAALLVVSGTKKEYKLVKNLLQFLLAAYFIFLIIFTIVQAVSDFKDFATLYNLKDFLLAPLLTVTFLPFIYFLALYATYEDLFTRVNLFQRNKDTKLRRFTKWQILRTCSFNLKKLNIFSKDYTPSLMSVKVKSDVVSLTRQFGRYWKTHPKEKSAE
jgi:hypothetical protein